MKIDVYLNDSISPHLAETHTGDNIRPSRDEDGVLTILTHEGNILGMYNQGAWSHVVVQE